MSDSLCSVGGCFTSSAYYLGNHPVTVGRTLIQLGYEPLKPQSFPSSARWRPFAKPTTMDEAEDQPKMKFLPGMHTYIKYIYDTEGVNGLYRGLAFRIVGEILSVKVANSAKSLFDGNDDPQKEEEEKDMGDQDLGELAKSTAVNMLGKVTSCLVLHPFQVLSVRCVAEFIDGQSLYDTLAVWRPVLQVYREEGVAGFYGGLVPRIIAECLSCTVVAIVTHTVNRHIIKDKTLKSWTQTIVQMAVSSILYPFYMVSTCMMVNGCPSVTAGHPPLIPEFDTWVDCWRHLESTGQLKRGSALFFRVLPELPVVSHQD